MTPPACRRKMSVGLGAPEKRLRVFRPSDRDPHIRPAVATVLRSNPAAVSPRDQLHDRESEPASATTARVERAAEAVEGVSDELRREPGPLVLYVQLDELAARSRGETLTPPAGTPDFKSRLRLRQSELRRAFTCSCHLFASGASVALSGRLGVSRCHFADTQARPHETWARKVRPRRCRRTDYLHVRRPDGCRYALLR
jgi:hypothetical protein